MNFRENEGRAYIGAFGKRKRKGEMMQLIISFSK